METELFVLSHLLLLSSREALPFLYRSEVGGREIGREGWSESSWLLQVIRISILASGTP